MNMEHRPHPMFWQGLESADVLSPGGEETDESLNLLGLPKGILRPAAPRLGAGDPVARAAVKHLLRRIEAALTAAAEDGATRLIPLDGLAPAALALLDEALGEGEASIMVTGPVTYQVQESVFPGVWDVRCYQGDGPATSRHLEVGPLPMVVDAAARALTQPDIVLPDAPEDAMNAPSLLAEIRHRMTHHPANAPNHVIGLTNLPMTPGDLAMLAEAIGGVVIRAHTKGYGAARITATRAARVWQVEYLNAGGLVILDTLEIGGPPAALLAAREDFEDSAARVAELIAMD
jgi:hydrogenase-1 operon protein HyaF